MLTKFEQNIYNEHLKISRTAQNKPYKFRKSFDDIDATKTLYIQKIARILNKFTNISPRDFFFAPYSVYGSEENFDLKFYTTQRALKVYTMYMNQEVDTDPDSINILTRVGDSLRAIKLFLDTEKISIDDYILHTTNNFPTFIQHLKERKLSIYIAQELPSAIQIIKQQDPDVMKFMFGENFYNNLNVYRSRYLNSIKCKALIKEGLKRLGKHIVD